MDSVSFLSIFCPIILVLITIGMKYTVFGTGYLLNDGGGKSLSSGHFTLRCPSYRNFVIGMMNF